MSYSKSEKKCKCSSHSKPEHKEKKEKKYTFLCDEKCRCREKLEITCSPTIPAKADFVVGGGAPEIPNNQRFFPGYCYKAGPLAPWFDFNGGKFTANLDGIYSFTFSLQWTPFQEQGQGPNYLDGNRYAILNRSRNLPNCTTNVGQYHSVPPENPKTPLLQLGPNPRFANSTVMNLAIIWTMKQGDSIQLELFQNNTKGLPICCYIEFQIIRRVVTPEELDFF